MLAGMLSVRSVVKVVELIVSRYRLIVMNWMSLRWTEVTAAMVVGGCLGCVVLRCWVAGVRWLI